MDLPKRKKGPKLPPEPPGGRAAARQRQFYQERGLEDASLQNDAEKGSQPAESEKTKNCEKKKP